MKVDLEKFNLSPEGRKDYMEKNKMYYFKNDVKVESLEDRYLFTELKSVIRNLTLLDENLTNRGFFKARLEKKPDGEIICIANNLSYIVNLEVENKRLLKEAEEKDIQIYTYKNNLKFKGDE
mgnify:CR=1 FL=1